MSTKKKRKRIYQTGKSNKRADKLRKAKKPGKRRTAHKTSYIERRKNPSDMPNSLTGLDRKLESAVTKTAYINKQIKELQKKIKESSSPAIKESYRAIIRIRKKQLTQLKKDLRKSNRTQRRVKRRK